MGHVVEGTENHGRSRGLVGCQLVQHDAYDHKRSHAEKRHSRSVARGSHKVWDSKLEREDGTHVFVHPKYANTKVEFKCMSPALDDEMPASGLGGTSGPGTFKHFITRYVHAIAKFDANRNTLSRGPSAAAVAVVVPVAPVVDERPPGLLMGTSVPPEPPAAVKLSGSVPPPPPLAAPAASLPLPAPPAGAADQATTDLRNVQ